LKLIAGLILFFSACHVFGQVIIVEEAEYFFDTDPGVGNGTAIVLSPANPVTFTHTISTAGLAGGHHILFIRTKGADDVWSLYEPQAFYIEPTIVAAEYFFDSDPGMGLATDLSITPGVNPVTFTKSISTASLMPGHHVLFVRTKSELGDWSMYEPQGFYIRVPVVEAEWFVDTDPGMGNGTAISMSSPTDLVSFSTTITPGLLPDGDHFLFIRTKDVFGTWSCYEPQIFTVDAALPIELGDFRATVTSDNQVRLDWTTFTEHNNHFFSAQHSTDGEVFKEIANVNGAGDSRLPLKYSVMHQWPTKGLNYYRLKQVDFDARSSFSNVLAIQLNPTGTPMVYPNPIKSEWYIDLTSTSEGRLIELWDLTGRKHLSLQAAGEELIPLARMEIQHGIYILKVTSPNGSSTIQKLIFH
jgi:hypothetical protein